MTTPFSHRDSTSHSCTPTAPAAPPRNEAARQLLAKNFPSHSAAKPVPKVKKSQNKQIAIMQMHRRAKPADPKDDRPSVNVPINDRLHVQVEIEDGLGGNGDANVPMTFWLRKVRFFLLLCGLTEQQHISLSHCPLHNTWWMYARVEHWHRTSIGCIGWENGGEHDKRGCTTLPKP